jgi:Ni/Co efflux regulator RcnB
MKSTAIAFAIATAALGFGSLAYAQHDGRGDYRDGRRDGQDGQYRQRQYQENGFQQHQQQYRQSQFDQRRQYEPRYQPPQYSQRGYHSQYGQVSARAPQYRRGEYLPYQFRQHQYYVNDWRAHRLYEPPRGYRWVQEDDGGDYLLVAIASGLIANLLLSQ